MTDDEEDAGDDHRGSSPSEERRRRPVVAASPAASTSATPDDVLQLLETCQLTDEEADELLKDAYALNRLLRAHLAHVEASNGAAVRGHHGGDSANSGASLSGKSRQSSGGFSRQLGGGAGRHEQSSSRRSVSLSGRTHVAVASSMPSSQQHRLPPIRAKSPSQRLSEMARAYSSGVIQPGHRSGGRGDSSCEADAAKSAKKRL